MESFVYAYDERLANPGESVTLTGVLPQKGYELGDHSFELPEGLSYDLVLTNAGEGILATGMLRARVLGTCDRCLDDAEFDVAGEVDEYYLFEEPAQGFGQDDDEEEGPDFSLVGPDNTIDLTDALMTALVMETPFIVLCSEDCKGLCPVCGTNLNHEDCGHAGQVEESRLESNPFAVLKGLKLDDPEDAE